ncbi:Uncharacterized protein DAT39_008935, partial [Clarias magur]
HGVQCQIRHLLEIGVQLRLVTEKHDESEKKEKEKKERRVSGLAVTLQYL